MPKLKSTLILLGVVATVVTAIQLANTPKASAQATIRPAMVRSVDEPARVPYLVDASPTCPFLNQCILTGTTVPAGKRLRITSIGGLMFQVSSSGFAALKEGSTLRALFPVSVTPAAYYGNSLAFNYPVDYYFEAGETPGVEIGVPAGAGGLPASSFNRLRMVGYLVDVAP